MKPRARFLLLTVVTGLLTFLSTGLIWAQSYSHARIVRLSFVEGTVTVQRPDVPDWAQAPVNTPLQEGFKLSTAENSFAEAQFENGSTVRLGQLTLVEFTQLALSPSGGKINRLTLQNGYATFHTLPELDDVYAVNTPNGTLTPQGNTMFRVDLDQGVERLEVFKGSVDVASFLGAWTLAKNQVLELQPGTDQPSNLTEGITEDAWDEWVSERESHPNLPQRGPSPTLYSNNVTDLMYGWNDLSQYGMWSDIPGYGYGWIPTVSLGWAPYTFGRWCWYPSFGYTWISFEPWGWLPYHFGDWDYFPGMGWAWFPDSFGTWSPAPVDWYAGPGWIGWVPRPRGGVHGADGCAQAQRCGAVVRSNSFQNGAIINQANILPIDPSQGQRINGPNIQPGRPVMLPGAAVSPPGAFAGASAGLQGGPGNRGRVIDYPAPSSSAAEKAAPVTAAPLGRPDVRGVVTAPESTIVFDPAEGRYVNNPNVRPVARPQPSGGAPEGVPAVRLSLPGMTSAVPASLPQTSPNRGLGLALGTGPVASPVPSGPPVRPAPSPKAQITGGRSPSMTSEGHMSSGGFGGGGWITGGGGRIGGGGHGGGGHR